MSKEGIIVIVSILIALLPFIGVPYSWAQYALPVLGLFSAALAFVLLRARRQSASPQAALPFSQYEAPPSVS